MSNQSNKRTRRLTDSPNKELCVSCGHKATKEAIECERCSKWEHKTCAQVSDNIYAEINDVPKNIKFFCTPCCSVISFFLEMHGALDDALSSVNVKLDNLEAKFTKSLDDINTKLSIQLNDIESKLKLTVSDQLKNIESKLQVTVADDRFSHQLKEIETKLCDPNTTFEKHLKALEDVSKQASAVTINSASKIVDEYRDLERRKWNLMFFNVPEHNSVESSQRKVKDRDFVNSLVDSIGAGPIDIVDVVRLGAKASNKPRPLRVQLSNLSHRRSILAKAKKLRESSSSIFKEVFINPDLSLKERQAQRELRQELAKRKESGETGIFIRRGRIVKQQKPDNSPPVVAMDHQNA